MSVDPDQPSSSEAASPKADPSGESAETLRQKRRFRKGGAESEEGGKSDQTIQLLSTLLQDLIAKKETPVAAPETDPKQTKYHRLSKTGSGTTGAPSETVAPTGSALAASKSADASPAAPSEISSSAPPPPPAVTFRPAPLYTPSSTGKWIWICVLGFLVFVGLTYATIVYFSAPKATSETGESRSPSPGLTSPWTDAALSQLDQALAADQAGDLKGAQRLATAIKKPESLSPPGLDLYLATLSTRLEHTYDVESDLLRASAKASPAEAAAINERLAFNFSRARDFDNATNFYRYASQTDPFPAPLFYHWGEVLRHRGHFQEAAVCFRRALIRIPTGQPETESLRLCIDLKLRLALLELGQESEFQNEMAEQLKAPQASGYWLLTAAAVAFQHKNVPEASAYLARARDALGKEQFDALLNDYFFRSYADRKELAEFFPLDPAVRRAKLMPTMTYSIDP